MSISPARPTERAAGAAPAARWGFNRRLVLLIGLLLAAACTSQADGEALPSPIPSPATSATGPAAPPTPSEDPAAAALAAYGEYLRAWTSALAAGDPGAPALAELATDSALQTARQQLQANQADGVIATGTIQPAATLAEITVEGDRATIRDCLLNDLTQVPAANTDEVVAPANGNRQPLTATLTQAERGWMVSETTGPELRGPVLGGEACAPPAVAQELIERYEAYWDAVYAAGDPGGGQPADPDNPRLAETMVDPQLADTRESFAELRAAGQVLRGRPDTAPVVLGLFEYDQLGVVLDCVITPAGAGIFDVATNQPIDAGGDTAGERSLDSTQMRFDGATWNVANWDIGEVQPCTRPGE